MRTLRILIIIQAICLLGSVAAVFLTWDTMPPLFRNYEGPPSVLDSFPALAGAVFVLSLNILIASWTCLWLGMRYSREIYAAFFLIFLLLPEEGPIFRTPWGNLLGNLDTLANGAILALTFLTDLRHTFRPKGKGSSAKGSSGSGDTSGSENPPSPRDPAII